MEELWLISDLPNKPAVYALCAGRRGTTYVYVGYTKTLKTRIFQHLVARDSSINTATAAVRLNPDRITEIRWWISEGPCQEKSVNSPPIPAVGVRMQLP